MVITARNVDRLIPFIEEDAVRSELDQARATRRAVQDRRNRRRVTRPRSR